MFKRGGRVTSPSAQVANTPELKIACQDEGVQPPESLRWTSIVAARFRIGGAVCVFIGFGFTVILAFAASSDSPPDGAQSALLVVIAGLFQLAATALFVNGRPSRETTKTSIRHLAKALINLIEARKLAEAALDDGTAPVTRAAVGELSFRLEAIEQQLTTNLEDWAIGHPALMNEDFLKETP